MNRLEILYDSDVSSGLPLPSELTALYGSLTFASHPGRPYIISNFVSTLDGVVSLDASGKAVGDVISGSNQQDSMVMGLLRAAADIVMVGAGTLRASPQHIWTPQHIFPSYADAYKLLRERMGKQPSPLNVIVTAHGNVDLSLPIFQSDNVPVLIVTTMIGARQFNTMDLPESVQVIEGSNTTSITAREILKAVATVSPSCETILIEGGPHLIGDFFAEHCLDELFLTLAPQLAGRKSSIERLGVVAEKIFAPEHPVWGKLVSVKRGGSHLFLRYSFESIGVM
jgi:riboflavin biosynthesis pyrimidine reductase